LAAAVSMAAEFVPAGMSADVANSPEENWSLRLKVGPKLDLR